MISLLPFNTAERTLALVGDSMPSCKHETLDCLCAEGLNRPPLLLPCLGFLGRRSSSGDCNLPGEENCWCDLTLSCLRAAHLEGQTVLMKELTC